MELVPSTRQYMRWTVCSSSDLPQEESETIFTREWLQISQTGEFKFSTNKYILIWKGAGDDLPGKLPRCLLLSSEEDKEEKSRDDLRRWNPVSSNHFTLAPTGDLFIKRQCSFSTWHNFLQYSFQITWPLYLHILVFAYFVFASESEIIKIFGRQSGQSSDRVSVVPAHLFAPPSPSFFVPTRLAMLWHTSTIGLRCDTHIYMDYRH